MPWGTGADFVKKSLRPRTTRGKVVRGSQWVWDGAAGDETQPTLRPARSHAVHPSFSGSGSPAKRSASN